MKRFKEYTKPKDEIPIFDQFTNFHERKKKLDLPVFDNFVDFRDKKNKKPPIKENHDDEPWLRLTKDLHDHSARDMSIDPEESYKGHIIHNENLLTLDHPNINERYKLLDNLKDHYKNFDSNDLDAIHDYTTSSVDFNKYLHNKKDENDERSQYERFNNRLKNMMNSHEAYPHGHYVYSGIGTSVNNDPMSVIKKHGVIRNKMYVSASTHPHVARGFSDTDVHGNRNMAKIYIPGENERHPNTPKTAHISKYSTDPQEYETLIEPSHMIFHPKPSIIQTRFGKYHHIYHGKIVSPEEAEEYHKKMQELKR